MKKTFKLKILDIIRAHYPDSEFTSAELHTTAFKQGLMSSNEKICNAVYFLAKEGFLEKTAEYKTMWRYIPAKYRLKN